MRINKATEKSILSLFAALTDAGTEVVDELEADTELADCSELDVYIVDEPCVLAPEPDPEPPTIEASAADNFAQGASNTIGFAINGGFSTNYSDCTLAILKLQAQLQGSSRTSPTPSS